MVGDQPEFGQSKVSENLTADAELALIHGHRSSTDTFRVGQIGSVDVLDSS